MNRRKALKFISKSILGLALMPFVKRSSQNKLAIKQSTWEPDTDWIIGNEPRLLKKESVARTEVDYNVILKSIEPVIKEVTFEQLPYLFSGVVPLQNWEPASPDDGNCKYTYSWSLDDIPEPEYYWSIDET